SYGHELRRHLYKLCGTEDSVAVGRYGTVPTLAGWRASSAVLRRPPGLRLCGHPRTRRPARRQRLCGSRATPAGPCRATGALTPRDHVTPASGKQLIRLVPAATAAVLAAVAGERDGGDQGQDEHGDGDPDPEPDPCPTRCHTPIVVTGAACAPCPKRCGARHHAGVPGGGACAGPAARRRTRSAWPRTPRRRPRTRRSPDPDRDAGHRRRPLRVP